QPAMPASRDPGGRSCRHRRVPCEGAGRGRAPVRCTAGRAMKLVEAEATGPVEGEDAIVTPPRPPHRRASGSLLFTLSVLVGTVVTIYVVFPARHGVLVTEAIEHHREVSPAWDLAAPSPAELRAWAIGAAGKDVPLPPGELEVIGARKIDILN